MSSRPLPCALFALALSGCESCPPDPHVITGMRVLGTTFDPPVATPGGSVDLRALTADVASRELAVAWYRCPSPFVLTPLASVDGGLDVTSQVIRCLASGELARGERVRVPIDREGGAEDVFHWRPPRRWTDLVGFACAGGSIEPPPTGGAWPRCTGTRGVLFTVSIPGPTSDGSTAAPPPATIVDLAFEGAPWREGTTPSVARCEDSRESCRAVPITFRVADASLALEVTSEGNGVLGTPSDDVAFVGYHVTGSAPATLEYCSTDSEAVIDPSGERLILRWVPPSRAGEVTFWFTARRYSGGLTMLRRTARVE